MAVGLRAPKGPPRHLKHSEGFRYNFSLGTPECTRVQLHAGRRPPAAACSHLRCRPAGPSNDEEIGNEKLQAFLSDDKVAGLLKQAEEFRPRLSDDQKERDSHVLISDLVSPDEDGSTLQWVQLVMQGGGMLGIAHVGYVCVLEEAGVRFLGLGGASAGAINGMLMACVRKKLTDKTWEEMLKIMLSPQLDFSDFEDGQPFFQKLRKNVDEHLNKAHPLIQHVFWFIGLVCKLACQLIKGNFNKAWQMLGVHPGDKFLDWIKGEMGKKGVTTDAQLREKLAWNCGEEGAGVGDSQVVLWRRKERSDEREEKLRLRDKARTSAEPMTGTDITSAAVDFKDPGLTDVTATIRSDWPLKLVTSELITQSKVQLPKDAHLFYKGGEGGEIMACPADYVRASMSIPLFFQPFRLNIPEGGAVENDSDEKRRQMYKAWKEATGNQGPVPKEAIFVDGGTLSNFPIELFHRPVVPLLPTLGARLGSTVPTTNDSSDKAIMSPLALLSSMFNCSKNMADKDFLQQNRDYRHLLQTINTADFNWLNFTMTDGEKKRLFVRGMEAGVEFLKTWRMGENYGAGRQKWEAYKAERAAKLIADWNSTGHPDVIAKLR